jgi:hypothetical protein
MKPKQADLIAGICVYLITLAQTADLVLQK